MSVPPLVLSLLVPSAMLAAYAMVYPSLERMWPARSDQPRLRDVLLVDLAYALLSMLLTVGLDAVPYRSLVETAGASAAPALQSLRAGIAGLPVALAALCAVVIADLAGYWKHRLFHTRGLWRFHAVHHSSEVVDWLSNERIHPVEAVITAWFQVLPLLLLGFSPVAVGVAVLVRRAHSLYEHANLRFSYIRLERVFVSPRCTVGITPRSLRCSTGTMRTCSRSSTGCSEPCGCRIARVHRSSGCRGCRAASGRSSPPRS